MTQGAIKSLLSVARTAAAVRSAAGDNGPACWQFALGEWGIAAGCGLAWPDGAHGGVEADGRGAAAGAAAEHGRGWAGRSGLARRGAPGGVRVPDRVLPVLAAATGPHRLHLWPVRGELHRGRPGR